MVTFTNQNTWNGLQVAKILLLPVTSPIPRVLIGGHDPPLSFTCCKDSTISCRFVICKTHTHTVNVKNFTVEIFLLYLRAPLHRKNIVHEMSPCFSCVTMLLVVDSLWTFAATSSQSCLHSPLPHSRVFTHHCRTVVSSLATANGPLRHSSVCVTV